MAAIAAYAIDALGAGVQPWPSLLVALVVSGVGAAAASRSDRVSAELLIWAGVVIVLSAVLLRMGPPSHVPPGRGPDLTHHLLLVDYIERTGHLVHDRALDGSMGEMAHYTPASHVLAVMAGRWFGTDGLHAFFPVAVVCCALTAGFLFLIGRRQQLSVPHALIAVLLLFLPVQYFFGAFTHDGFLSQAVSTLFAVAMWWAIVVWDSQPSRMAAALVSVFLVATFLSWPIWLGPPLLVFLLLSLRAPIDARERAVHWAIVLVPLLVTFAYHSAGRWGWMVIVRTSGAVLHPSLESLGWVLPVLAVLGVVLGASDSRGRVSLMLLCAALLQAASLYTIAKLQGAHTPYMAFKMVYFLIYPLAVFAAIALAKLSALSRSYDNIGWLMAALLMALAVRPAVATPRVLPVADDDLYAMGRWVRANGAATCTDYLVADAETAYWLHLAVLGNSRSGPRMAVVDGYDARAAVAPWITSAGRRYAIADLRLLPAEVRAHVELVAESGHAAVIRERNATMKGCD